MANGKIVTKPSVTQPNVNKSAGCKLSKGQINFLIFLLVAIILMVASGLAVYYVFCIPPNNSEVVNTTSVTAPTTTACPTVRPPSNCPTRPVCVNPPLCPLPTAVPCPPRPTPACLPCPTYPPCNAPNCAVTCPPIIITTTTTARPIVLTENELYTNRALDLIRRYPVRSFERLQAAIQVLEAGSEYYFRTFTSRNCHKDYKRVCKVCTDRYVWLRCVFNNNVTGHVLSTSYTNYVLVKEHHTFPKDFRSRAFESARVSQYNGGTYQLEDAQYNNRWSNHEAMALTYDEPNGRKGQCTSCEADMRHRFNMECIVYAGYDKSELCNTCVPIRG